MSPERPAPADRSAPALLEFGVVAVDKPAGPTSHQVSAWVRDLLDVGTAAHAGTLDPKVTGCLPVLVGDGTRVARALTAARKEYVTVLEAHAPLPPDHEATIDEFRGEIYQKPPRKSAVKRRLRVRTIDDLEVLERQGRQLLLRVRCQSGTYIRKLCHDLGLALGTGAHMGDLRRTASGPFDDSALVTLHDIADAVAAPPGGRDRAIESVVQPAEAALVALPTVTIAPSAASAVATGAPGYAPGVLDGPTPPGDGEPPLVVCSTPDGTAICLGRLVGDPDATEGMVVDLERVLVA